MSRRVPERRERGVALLLVLWVFMTLGVLALDFARYMRDDATAALNLAEETRGYYLALAGMNRALYDAGRARQDQANAPKIAGTHGVNQTEQHGLEGDENPDEPLFRADGQPREATFAGGTFRVRMTGEDGKIPLNVDITEDPERKGTFKLLLTYVITNLVRGGNQATGVDRDTDKTIRTIVDSIIDWRDCDNTKESDDGAESEYYLGLAHPHRAKNGYFDSLEELLQVRGVTPEIFYGHDDVPGLVDVFSIYPKGKDLVINAGQLTPEVVRVLVPSFSQSDATDFLSSRDDDPQGSELLIRQTLDGVAPEVKVETVEPQYVRVEARGDVKQQRNQSAVMAIVKLGDNDAEGPHILSWVDRVPIREEPAAQPAGTARSSS